MSQVKTILQALVKVGLGTYDDLEAETKLPRNKLRWTCNSMKQAGQIKQTEEPLTKEVAWQITPFGRDHLIKLAGEDIKAAPPHKSAQPKAPEKKKPASKESEELAKAKAKYLAPSNGKLQTTPAEGGVNIIRSLESESPIGAADTLTEVQAVVEQQEPELPSAPVSARSDVKSDIQALSDQLFQVADDLEPVEFTDPQLFAMISIDGTMHIAFAGKEINLPAFAVRQLGDFMSDTEPAWA